jgi:hypothetical protein
MRRENYIICRLFFHIMYLAWKIYGNPFTFNKHVKKNSAQSYFFHSSSNRDKRKKEMLLITHLCSESRVCSAEHDASRTRLLYLLLNSPSTVTSIARRIRRALLFHAFFHLSWRGTVRESAASFQNLWHAILLGAEKPAESIDREFCELQIASDRVCVAGGRSSQVSGNITMSDRYYHVALHLTF